MTGRPDLDLLGSLCDAATPGPWTATNDDDSDWSILAPGPRYLTIGLECDPGAAERNTRYLAALDPETVRSLIADARIGRLAREVSQTEFREQARIHTAGADPAVDLGAYSRIVSAATDRLDSARLALDDALRAERAALSEGAK